MKNATIIYFRAVIASLVLVTGAHAQVATTKLDSDKTIERTISSKGEHRYEIRLSDKELVFLKLIQKDADVTVTTYDPSGHNGGDTGAVNIMRFNPNTGIGKILMTNVLPVDPMALTQFKAIWKILERFENSLDEPEARKRLDQVVACINEPDSGLRATFLVAGFEDQNTNSVKQRIAIVSAMRAGLEGLKVDKVLRSTNYRIIAHCKSANGSVVEVYLELSDRQPFRIKDIELDQINTVVRKGSYEDIIKLPDSKLGATVSALVDAVNANGDESNRDFIVTNMSLTEDATTSHAKAFRDAFKATGGLKFHSIRRYKNTSPVDPVVGIAQANGATRGMPSC